MKRVFTTKTDTHYYYSISSLILIIFFTITTSSCSAADEQPPVIPKGIAQEIKDLVYFKGDENAPIVLINAQSGPNTELSTIEVDLFFANFNTTDILMANVHQAQSLNPSILDDNDITLDQAVTFNTESIALLHKVISYFKDEGRTVYVLGISFGAFITQELIAKKGIDVADKYLIMTGRLDMNTVIWEGLSEGRSGFFEDGVTPMVDPEPAMNVLERNLTRIAAGLGMNRYTQLFNTIEDLSDLTYIYGATDEAVGSLTAEEVLFLESKNASVIAGSGGHDNTFDDFIVQGLKEAFGFKPLQ